MADETSSSSTGTGSAGAGGTDVDDEVLPPLVPIPISPNEPNRVSVPPTIHRASKFEIEDATFNHDSVVMLPEPPEPDPEDEGQVGPPRSGIAGLQVLRETYLYAKAHADARLLITAHTDTTGSDAYNITLSAKRAHNVLHLYLGKRDKWVESSKAKHRTRDIQEILNWVSKVWSWPCRVVVNDAYDAPTRSAVETFQSNYKAHSGNNISVDGIVGTQTWGAFFDMYMERLAQYLGVSDAGKIQPFRDELHWVDEGKKAVGCGESWPVEKPGEDEFRSQANRRIEVLFFEATGLPPMKCHPSDTSCVKHECKVYTGRFKITPVPIQPIEPGVYVLRILEPGPGSIESRRPLSHTAYRLRESGSSGPGVVGETDARGELRVHPLASGDKLELTIAGGKIALDCGALAKIDAGESGAKQRLYNLGYGPDDPASWDSTKQHNATKQFQKAHGLPESGMFDEGTKARLASCYGG